MNTQKIIRISVILLIVLSTIGCDQISKSVVRETIATGDVITIIPGYFTLTKIENSGAFLSLGDSFPAPLKTALLLALPVLALAYGMFYLLTRTGISRTTLTGLCFVTGGGIGNIYDRIVYGSVTDFMHVKVGMLQTGIFNIADVAIMVGIGLMMLQYVPVRETREV